MLSRILFFLGIFSIQICSIAQKSTIDLQQCKDYLDALNNCIKEDGGRIWGVTLKSNLIFVDPQSRDILATGPIIGFDLQEEDGCYLGKLKDDVSVGNTSINIKNEDWTMVMWPLPEDKNAALELMVHESFHSHQSALGFEQSSPVISHLNEKEGRLLFFLELNAIYNAATKNRKSLIDALVFRIKRFELYAQTANLEVELETNEGLAQYTGFKLAYTETEPITQYLEKLVKKACQVKSLSRSSAYFTGPLYGHVFDASGKEWRTHSIPVFDILKTSKSIFSIKEIDLNRIKYDSIKHLYGFDTIAAKENRRELEKNELLSIITNKFNREKGFVIDLKQMQISFNPSNIVPVENKGTFYPNCIIKDYFGTLNVQNGVLISSDFQTVVLTSPKEVTESSVSGQGWQIVLNNNYMVVKNRNGKYVLKKKF